MTTDPTLSAEASTRFSRQVDALVANVETVMRGKEDAVRRAVVCFLAGGHLLIDDVPGVGKTTLARALAASIDATCKRIQFTPDLLPSDVTGVSVWDEATRSFEFHPGPVFANIVVADEINRASPKTQSALLEVMEERTVTLDAVSRHVADPFLVVATQNPVEYEGTYRLPEAQRDRFLMQLRIGYPDKASEEAILTDVRGASRAAELGPVMSLDMARRLIDSVTGIHVAPPLRSYLVDVVAATRSWPEVTLGVSPRGGQALTRASQAWAAAHGRSFVVPDDVKELSTAVLAHRLQLTPDAELQGRSPQDVVAEIVASVRVPPNVGPP